MKDESCTLPGCGHLSKLIRGWRAETALTPGYYLAALRAAFCLLPSSLLLGKAVAEFTGDDERLDHVSLFKVAVEVVQLL